MTLSVAQSHSFVSAVHTEHLLNALSLEALFLSVFITLLWPVRPATVVVVSNTPVPLKLPTGWEGSYFSYILDLKMLKSSRF